MNALASLDGPTKREYRYRKPLGALGCACEATNGAEGTSSGPQITTYTTDLALRNQGLTDMTVVLNDRGIVYIKEGSNLQVTTPGGTVSVPALAPIDSVDGLVTQLANSLQSTVDRGQAITAQLTPEQKKWGKVLLFVGGTWLTWELFFSKKNKGVTVNVGKSLNGLAAPEPKKHSRKRKRSKVLETLSI